MIMILPHSPLFFPLEIVICSSSSFLSILYLCFRYVANFGNCIFVDSGEGATNKEKEENWK